jgi:hypothetical protein
MSRDAGKERHTIEIEIIHSSYIRLCLPTNETNTLFLSAITGLCIIAVTLSASKRATERERGGILPIAIDVVVKRQFFVLLDRAIREDAHPDVLPDRPLCDIAVWVARVIGETTNATAFCGIDELRTSKEKPGFARARCGRASAGR